MTILLDYFSEYVAHIEKDFTEDDLWDEFVGDNKIDRQSLTGNVRRAIEGDFQAWKACHIEGMVYDSRDEAFRYLEDMTYHISAPITKRTRQMWNGTQTVEEDTEEERTLTEWIETILSAGSFDDYRVYTEDGEVLMDFIHHDGTNHYRFGHHLAGEFEKALDY